MSNQKTERMRKQQTVAQDHGWESRTDSKRGIRINTWINIDRTRKRIAYSFMAKDYTNKLVLIWAAAE